jgi:hypothetical protein
MELVNGACMKKVIFLLLILVIAVSRPCRAVDLTTDDMLSWMNLTPKTATQEKVTSLLGQPAKVEENNKRAWWYYKLGNNSLVISWNKKSALLEKFSFSCESAVKSVFNSQVSRKLKSGSTDLIQAIKLLGVPKEMTIKSVTQEVHYAYEKSVLRLFFRNRTLVDYTLVTNNQ